MIIIKWSIPLVTQFPILARHLLVSKALRIQSILELNPVTKHCSNNTKTNLEKRAGSEGPIYRKCWSEPTNRPTNRVGPLFHKNAVSFFNACMSWNRKRTFTPAAIFLSNYLKLWKKNQVCFSKHPTSKEIW